ncbi:MAG: hypothetical protein JKY65_24410 [Planctomycetes bacterium]|nr:hypothetical protein [Planctomycetota bacterium]
MARYELTLEAICNWTGHGFGAVFEDFELTRIGSVADDCPFVVNEWRVAGRSAFSPARAMRPYEATWSLSPPARRSA